jgi:isocitrate/isopropylmalate dehydrogenase
MPSLLFEQFISRRRTGQPMCRPSFEKVRDQRCRQGARKRRTPVLLAAVGGPKWDAVPYEVRLEAGLLRLRKDMNLFANLRPAICYPALADASSLEREFVDGLDLMVVRELTGGVYFGEPKQIIEISAAARSAARDRYARVAFELAGQRRNNVPSSDERNVMKSGVLWDGVTTALRAREYPDVEPFAISNNTEGSQADTTKQIRGSKA